MQPVIKRVGVNAVCHHHQHYHHGISSAPITLRP